MTDTEKPTLLSALLAVQAKIPNLKLGRDAEGQIQNRKYKYLTLDKLHAEVLPLLNRHGLVWLTFPENSDKGPVLRYELVHEPAPAVAPQAYQGTYPGPTSGVIGGSMPLILGEQTSRALGSAITYARRYALLAVLGLAPVDEDDDGAAASTKPPVLEQGKGGKAPESAIIEFKSGISQDRSAGARLLSDEERKLLVDAIKDSGQNPQLLLASEGVEKSDELTVRMGESIMRKLAVK